MRNAKHILSSKALHDGYLDMTVQTQLIHINYCWVCIILAHSSDGIIPTTKILKSTNSHTDHMYE